MNRQFFGHFVTVLAKERRLGFETIDLLDMFVQNFRTVGPGKLFAATRTFGIFYVRCQVDIDMSQILKIKGEQGYESFLC